MEEDVRITMGTTKCCLQDQGQHMDHSDSDGTKRLSPAVKSEDCGANKAAKADADPLPKQVKTFVLSCEIELKIVSYIIKRQELGLSISASDVRKYAYEAAACPGKKNPFGERTDRAGWDWWVAFKARYGLNIDSKPTRFTDFYDSLEKVLDKFNLTNMPHRIWNLDEPDSTFFSLPSDVLLTDGGKHATSDNYDSGTVFVAANASGHCIPPLFIFKGTRLLDCVRDSIPALSKAVVSTNGEINSNIFLDFLCHFTDHIPPIRPVLLLLNSQTSNMCSDVLPCGEQNGIIFLTFPSNARTLLQPLQTTVFTHLKASWREKVEDFVESCGCKPSKTDLFHIFNRAFHEIVTPNNITKGFIKTGIFPFDREAVSDDDFEVSNINKIIKSPSKFQDFLDELDVTIPVPQPLRSLRKRKRYRDSLCNLGSSSTDFSLSEVLAKAGRRTVRPACRPPFTFAAPLFASPSTSGTPPDPSRPRPSPPSNVMCSTCGGPYDNEDDWVRCSQCECWFHELCQGLSSYSANFLCFTCREADSD